MKLKKILKKIQNYFSYAIIFFGLLQIFTGFANLDMIKFLSAETVHPFHKMYILIPLVFFATTHALIGIRQKIRFKNSALDIFFLLLGLGIIIVIAFYAIVAS
jgi:glucan phosphoethanolaminetransferase (alkaline phosphatase superfamily)